MQQKQSETMQKLLADFPSHLDDTLPPAVAEKDPHLSWLRNSRLAALKRTENMKIPVWKSSEYEEWRYTDLSEISKKEYVVPRKASIASLRNVSLEMLIDPELYSQITADPAATRIVLVNGFLIEGLSNHNAQLDQTKISSLKDLEEGQQRLFCRHLILNDKSPFPNLNTCYLNDGVIVETQPRSECSKSSPLYVIHIFLGGSETFQNAPEMYHPRTVYVASRDSTLNVVEIYVGKGRSRRFTNALTQIFLQENAQMNRMVLYAETNTTFTVSNCVVNAGNGSAITSDSFMLAGKLVRESTECRIAGEGADCSFSGTSAISGLQHFDQYTMVHHMKPRSKSRTNFKAILGENSIGVFTGRVRIDKGCSGTVAVQDSKSMLLSGNARSYSRPELYILNDDVQCRHGNTSGPLDEDAIIYLMNRGLGELTARRLLATAFGSVEVVKRRGTAFAVFAKFLERNISEILLEIFGRVETTLTVRKPLQEKFYDVASVKAQFPLLSLRRIHGSRKLIYLDNAATMQRPQEVIDAVLDFTRTGYSNVHRGVHELSEEATERLENARGKVARLIGAPSPEEIIFTSGTTESLNLVASSLSALLLGPKSRVLVSLMEHHSNFVPWQVACERTGAAVDYIPVTQAGEIDMLEYSKLLAGDVKVIAITHVSNVMGTINDVKKMIEMARAASPEVAVVVDGAQAVAHMKVNVLQLDCDFYAFSGHKMYGPSGVGALFGKRKWLEAMPPFHMGGGMISIVSKKETLFAPIPYKFEAGTPNVTGIVGLGAAVDFISRLNIDLVAKYEEELLHYCLRKMELLPGVKLIGNAADRVAVISFVVETFHAHDVGSLLDDKGIAIRAGHHCAMPLMQEFGIESSSRAAFGCYTTYADVDVFVGALKEICSTPDVAVMESSLYKELIMDHNRHPHNFSDLPGHTCSADGYNRLCGDQYRIFVKISSPESGEEAPPQIEKVTFTGSGCAISKASTSMMTSLISKCSVGDAIRTIDSYRAWLMSHDDDASKLLIKDIPDKLYVFSEIHKYPARVKCATIGWHALKTALGEFEAR